MALQVRRPKTNPPVWLIFFGEPGVGKTTLAVRSKTGKAVLLAFENVDVTLSQIGADAPDIIDPPKETGAIEALFRELATTNHGYETVIVDSLSALDAIAQILVVDENRSGNEQRALSAVGGGFGRGNDLLRDFHVRIAQYLAMMRDKGMRVILIGHRASFRVEEPGVEPYDRYSLVAYKEALIRPYMQNANAIGHVYVPVAVATDKKAGITRATAGSTVRVDFTSPAHAISKSHIEGMKQVFVWDDPKVCPFAQHLAAYESAPAAPFTLPHEQRLVDRAREVFPDKERRDDIRKGLAKAGYSEEAINGLFEKLAAEAAQGEEVTA